jgi:hypothetical protein
VGRAYSLLVGGVHTEFWWENIGVDGVLILILFLENQVCGVWTGFFRLRIETSAGPLLTW